MAALKARRRHMVVAMLLVILLLVVMHGIGLKDNLAVRVTHNCSEGSDFRYSYRAIGRDDNITDTLDGPALLEDNKLNDNDEFLVPNIVHYIWFSNKPKTFKFHHMLSVLSAHKFIKPDVIYFHTDMSPVGEYWDSVLKEVPEIQMVYRSPSTCLFGEPLKTPYFETSKSNVDRLRVLLETGGIYLDLDVLIVRSFDNLRRYPCTIGMETDTRACGGIIVCSKHSFFLNLWANAYLDNYRHSTWAYNTGIVPYYLAERYPHLVHVESTRLHRPNYEELHLLWGNHPYPWQKNYAIHIWYRVWKRGQFYLGYDPDYKSIQRSNSTFAQLARYILE